MGLAPFATENVKKRSFTYITLLFWYFGKYLYRYVKKLKKPHNRLTICLASSSQPHVMASRTVSGLRKGKRGNFTFQEPSDSRWKLYALTQRLRMRTRILLSKLQGIMTLFNNSNFKRRNGYNPDIHVSELQIKSS